jgi:hypothetical protein
VPLAALTGCGTPAPPVSIQLSAQPLSDQAYITPNVLTATVSNAKDPGIEWQLTCSTGQGDQCGKLSYPGTGTGTGTGGGVVVLDGLIESESGNQVNYLPPGPGIYTVTFTVFAVADKTKTASATITRGVNTALSLDMIPASMLVGSNAAISARISADPIAINALLKLGYTWTVTCGSTDCGTFSNSPTIPLGNQFSSDFTTAWGYSPYIQYNAPPTVPSGGAVTIKVTLDANATPVPSQPSATTTIAIAPAP